MKKIILLLLTLSLLSACSRSNQEVLRVYNWGEYISRYSLREFAKEYEIKVQYDVFSSNEFMYTKIASEDYDVLVPSDYMIQRLIEEDKLMKLDKSLLRNYDKIDEKYLNRQFDKNNEYAVPYFVGSVGIVYNKETVDAKRVEELGWDIFMDEEYKDRIFFYNSERDAFMVALKALGYSMNTENEIELNEAYEWLVEMKKTMNPVYVDDYMIDAMIAGEKDIALMYSGDASYVLIENEDLAYSEPYQGTNIWIDAMVLTKEVRNIELAHQFIDYILRPEVSEDISYEVGYTSPIKETYDKLIEDEYGFKGINSYTPRSGYDLDEEFYYNAQTKIIMSDLWNKVMASQ